MERGENLDWNLAETVALVTGAGHGLEHACSLLQAGYGAPVAHRGAVEA